MSSSENSTSTSIFSARREAIYEFNSAISMIIDSIDIRPPNNTFGTPNALLKCKKCSPTTIFCFPLFLYTFILKCVFKCCCCCKKRQESNFFESDFNPIRNVLCTLSSKDIRVYFLESKVFFKFDHKIEDSLPIYHSFVEIDSKIYILVAYSNLDCVLYRMNGKSIKLNLKRKKHKFYKKILLVQTGSNYIFACTSQSNMLEIFTSKELDGEFTLEHTLRIKGALSNFFDFRGKFYFFGPDFNESHSINLTSANFDEIMQHADSRLVHMGKISDKLSQKQLSYAILANQNSLAISYAEKLHIYDLDSNLLKNTIKIQNLKLITQISHNCIIGIDYCNDIYKINLTDMEYQYLTNFDDLANYLEFEFVFGDFFGVKKRNADIIDIELKEKAIDYANADEFLEENAPIVEIYDLLENLNSSTCFNTTNFIEKLLLKIDDLELNLPATYSDFRVYLNDLRPKLYSIALSDVPLQKLTFKLLNSDSREFLQEIIEQGLLKSVIYYLEQIGSHEDLFEIVDSFSENNILLSNDLLVKSILEFIISKFPKDSDLIFESGIKFISNLYSIFEYSTICFEIFALFDISNSKVMRVIKKFELFVSLKCCNLMNEAMEFKDFILSNPSSFLDSFIKIQSVENLSRTNDIFYLLLNLFPDFNDKLIDKYAQIIDMHADSVETVEDILIFIDNSAKFSKIVNVNNFTQNFSSKFISQSKKMEQENILENISNIIGSIIKSELNQYEDLKQILISIKQKLLNSTSLNNSFGFILSNKFIFSESFDLEYFLAEIIQKSVAFFSNKIENDQTNSIENSFSLLIKFVDSFIDNRLDTVDFSRRFLNFLLCKPNWKIVDYILELCSQKSSNQIAQAPLFISSLSSEIIVEILDNTAALYFLNSAGGLKNSVELAENLSTAIKDIYLQDSSILQAIEIYKLVHKWNLEIDTRIIFKKNIELLIDEIVDFHSIKNTDTLIEIIESLYQIIHSKDELKNTFTPAKQILFTKTLHSHRTDIPKKIAPRLLMDNFESSLDCFREYLQGFKCSQNEIDIIKLFINIKTALSNWNPREKLDKNDIDFNELLVLKELKISHISPEAFSLIFQDSKLRLAASFFDSNYDNFLYSFGALIFYSSIINKFSFVDHIKISFMAHEESSDFIADAVTKLACLQHKDNKDEVGLVVNCINRYCYFSHILKSKFYNEISIFF